MQENISVRTLKAIITGLGGRTSIYGLKEDQSNRQIDIRFCPSKHKHKTALIGEGIGHGSSITLWYDAGQEEFQLSLSCFSRVFFVIPKDIIKPHLKEKLKQFILDGKIKPVYRRTPSIQCGHF